MRITFLLLSFCCQFFSPSSVYADDDELPDNSLSGWLNYARAHNPDFEAALREAEAAGRRVEFSSALPDPVLRTEWMDAGNPGTGSTRYLLMQSLPWFGKRELQSALAETQREQMNDQTAATWNALEKEIKTVYARLFFLRERERLTGSTLALFEKLEKIAQGRYVNGRGTQQEIIRIQIEISALQNDGLALKNERHHAHIQINRLLSRPGQAALPEPASFRPLPLPANLDESALLQRLAQRNPQLKIVESAIESAEKNRDLARLNHYPGITLGIAPTQGGGVIKSWDVMLELNLPLQQASRRSQAGEAEALRLAAIARKQSLWNQSTASLSENLAGLLSAQQSLSLINARLLPQSQLSYQSALVGYETGSVDFATLIAAQQQILQIQQQALSAQFEAQMRLAELEALLGETL